MNPGSPSSSARKFVGLVRDLIGSRLAVALLGVSAAVAVLAWRAGEQRASARAEAEARAVAGAVDQRVRLARAALQGVAGAVAGRSAVDPERWGAFVAALDLPGYDRGLRELGFAQRQAVAPAPALGGGASAIDRGAGERFVVVIAARGDGGRGAVSLDLSSDRRVEAAVERARDDGEPVLLVAPAALVAGAEPSLLLLLPVYREAPAPATVVGRRRALMGMAYAVQPAHATIPELLPAAPPGAGDDDADVAVDLEPQSSPPRDANRGRVTVLLTLAGHPAAIHVQARRSRGAEIPLGVFAGVLGLGVLVAVLAGWVRSERNRARAFVEAMGVDLSAHVEVIRSLEAAAVEAEEAAAVADRAKRDFLANVSHELRTPMQAILGYTELLLEPEIDQDERLEYAGIVKSRAMALLSMVNDVLDLSQIEAGKLAMERTRFSPGQLLSEVASVARAEVAKKRLTFEVVLRGPIPATIEGDPTRIRQILTSLVSNAIKFTDSGSVRVTTRCEMAEPKRPRLSFTVADTGIGMDREQFERLFRPFTQVDTSTTRRFGGMGLGLVISRHLAGLIGATVTAESEPHHGTTFTLTVDTGPLDGIEMVSATLSQGTRPRSSAASAAG